MSQCVASVVFDNEHTDDEQGASTCQCQSHAALVAFCMQVTCLENKKSSETVTELVWKSLSSLSEWEEWERNR